MSKIKVPLAKPILGEAEEEAALRVIRSGWVTQGPEVAAFEKEFADYVGAAEAVAVSSCTTGLHIALLLAGVGPQDEVITVSHSYIATVNAIRYCGAIPIMVDVDLGTFNIDAKAIEAAITSRTKAILCVHQMGMPCDLEQILKVAERNQIPVVEDAACAIGSEIRFGNEWQRIGAPHGELVCFSFHPRKLLTTGDGGMITCRTKPVADRLKRLRQHGMTVSDAARHASDRVVFEEYPEVGFNYRMTDIQAAIGREQLKRIDSMVSERRRLAARYTQLLSGLDSIETPIEPEWARTNWQSYCIRLSTGLDQQTVMQKMLDLGIATRRGIMCAHLEQSYADAARPFKLPRSEEARSTGVILPLFPGMTEDEQDRVVNALKESCAHP